MAPRQESRKHSASSSRSRIVETAARLFAESGFAGVTTRTIAAETGLNIATVHHHVGTKRELYRAVIEALFEREEALIMSLLDRMEDQDEWTTHQFRSLLRELIHGLVQLASDRPERQRLYLRRWLEPPDELRAREAELTLRLYRRVAALLENVQVAGLVRDDLDVENFLRSFDWLIMGYFTSGAFDWRTLRTDPLKPSHLNRFEEYLCEYAERMLGMDPADNRE